MPVEKDKALTPEKKDLLIGQVQLEIENINNSIRSGGLGSGVLEVVKTNRDSLQGVLNKLFEKKGVITPEETNKTIEAIDKSKKARLEKDFNQGIKRALIIFSLILVAGVGYSYYIKSKNK
jgi:hypothetical protein